MMGCLRLVRLIMTAALSFMIAGAAAADTMTRAEMASQVLPPNVLGPRVDDGEDTPDTKGGIYHLLNSGGGEIGYVFETEPLAALPGFSGAPINVMVTIDLEGRFLDVKLIDHNEPIFVSGLGQAAFHGFFVQYGGLSIASPMVVGVPYGDKADGGALVYLDGVTKATASVRIAHESILAATRAVVRERLQGVATSPPAFPDLSVEETLNWSDLVEQGIARNLRVTNAELQAAFADTLWEDDDPIALAEPDGVYLDLWIVDVGPPSVARAALSQETYGDLQEFLTISDHDEPILVIDAGRHGLVSPDFIRNTSPDWLSARQDDLPVALRDADLFVELGSGVPDGEAMILRTDRRLGFDPTREWTMEVRAERSHGNFQPEIGAITLTTNYMADERFFTRPVVIEPSPPWVDALRNRQADLIILAVFLVGLVGVLALAMNRFAALSFFIPVRLTVLAFMTVFVGWWGQGQLSIVTPLAVMRTAIDGGAYDFLLYDPFSLVIWAIVIVSFVAWGRGLFCGWLCPFGALQEFANWIGKILRLPQIDVPDALDNKLKYLKYVVLAGIVGTVIVAPAEVDTVAEVEPFKTAITVFFVREWYYVAYAMFWILLSMMLFKGFCRYVCPLGAVMAIGGLIRGRDWIARRAECGSPCQLCKVKCAYGAIRKTGEIQYSECFQCLDCVTIHDDEAKCVPLILAARGRGLTAPVPRLKPMAAE